MLPLTAVEIRGSFVNASQGEAERLPMPGLHEVMWQQREYLGWRDQQAHHRAYLVHWLDDRPVGLLLTASEFGMRPGISAMCSLCRTTRRSDEVTLFAAPRAGQAGREGNTVGMYVCDDLACSHLIRILPPPSDLQDPGILLSQRIEGLERRLRSFTADIMKTA
jgi:hypothetical protein